MRAASRRRTVGLVAIAGAAALLMSACSSDTDTGSGTTTAPATTASSAAESSAAESSAAETSAEASESSEAPESSGEVTEDTSAPAENTFVGSDDDFCDVLKAAWPDTSGKNVTVYTGISGVEAEDLKTSFKPFEECSGATVEVNSDKNFETQIVVQANSGSAPDIAFVPQPGLLQALVATNTVKAAPAQVATNVEKYWDPGWKSYGTVNDTFYAAPLGANVKSLVWYSPKEFTEAGYAIPQTWDEMIALSDTIAGTGKKPWCAGVESGAATGWPATDWMEEVVMRQAGPDVYDQWIAGEVKFTDPPIVEALATVGTILKNDAYVNGGWGDVASIASTDFAIAGGPILTGECSMMQMASFYASNWEEGTNIAEDGDIFAFYEPVISDEFGKPVEVGGEFVTAFADRPEVQAFQYYVSTAFWANEQSKAGQRISANKGLDIANVKDPINKLSVSILQDPDAISRFDASDLMPAAVGSGAMWSQLTAWLTGQDDAATLEAIQAAWPAN